MSPEPKADSPRASLEGHLLIAAPRMDDPRFARSVVLVLKHDEEGAMGVVLNRPVDDSMRIPGPLAEMFSELQSIDTIQTSVHIGGPMAGPLIALRTQADRLGRGGVYLIEGQSQLRQLASQSTGPLQFFVGHAGWDNGQLEEELASGCWMTLPAAADFLDSDHQVMWVNALRESGRSVYREALGIRGFPQDATLN